MPRDGCPSGVRAACEKLEPACVVAPATAVNSPTRPRACRRAALAQPPRHSWLTRPRLPCLRSRGRRQRAAAKAPGWPRWRLPGRGTGAVTAAASHPARILVAGGGGATCNSVGGVRGARGAAAAARGVAASPPGGGPVSRLPSCTRGGARLRPFGASRGSEAAQGGRGLGWRCHQAAPRPAGGTGAAPAARVGRLRA